MGVPGFDWCVIDLPACKEKMLSPLTNTSILLNGDTIAMDAKAEVLNALANNILPTSPVKETAELVLA